jgi:hypothetical protein
VHREGEGKRIKGEDSDTHTHTSTHTNKQTNTLQITQINFSIRKIFKGNKTNCCGNMDIRGQINWIINWISDEELE